jgi:Uma2 family endonuclease
MPDDGKRYEIIDGELYVSKQPHFYHQQVCGTIYAALHDWSKQTGLGRPSLASRSYLCHEADVITSPLLPGFSCPVAELFAGIPHRDPESQE